MRQVSRPEGSQEKENSERVRVGSLGSQASGGGTRTKCHREAKGDGCSLNSAEWM